MKKFSYNVTDAPPAWEEVVARMKNVWGEEYASIAQMVGFGFAQLNMMRDHHPCELTKETTGAVARIVALLAQVLADRCGLDREAIMADASNLTTLHMLEMEGEAHENDSQVH